MSTALNLPLWQCNSPPNSPDSSEDLDLIADRFSSVDKPSLYRISGEESQIPLDNGMPARRLSLGSDCGSVRRMKFEDACRLNNNVSDSGDCNVEKCNAEYAKSRPKRRRSRNVSSSDEEGDGSRKMRKSFGKSEENGSNVVYGLSSECDAGMVGGDEDDDDEDEGGGGGEEERKRSPRRQHQLIPSVAINTSDVTGSRGITSNCSIVSKSCASNGRNGSCGEGESRRRGSCSAGSYSRRKHHKHHKHKRSQSPAPEETTPVSPKVNPIFLWVRQDDTRIVEVMCEDYDRRNRIRLTRTHLGWRAIPKTEVFAAAIIPKAPPAAETAADENCVKGNRRRRSAKKRKGKKSKVPVQSVRKGSLNEIKECSVTVSRDDLEERPRADEAGEGKTSSRASSMESIVDSSASGPSPGSPSRMRSPSAEPPDKKRTVTLSPMRLTKSFSCDFSLVCKRARKLVRSGSLDLNMDRENKLELEKNFKVQNKSGDEAKKATEGKETVNSGVKPEVNEHAAKEVAKMVEALAKDEGETADDVVDISKRDPDFNDTDCDELGELLKDIPDLEFVEEEELQEEELEWSTPTDLTVPKAKSEEREYQKIKLPILPPNISPLVTVTSATKPAEPLTAPLPEVTITPIPNPNPKPAHQQKRQHNFLESLLSLPYPVKPEKDEVTVTRSYCEKKQAEKKKLHQLEADSRSKKMKVEDITLKSLLSKHHNDRTIKGLELENHVKKIKSKQENESVDVSKSRLHELLTEGVSSSSSDPISQLKQVLSNPDLAVPDPLLVPRARLPALVASPASEIPRLLSMHLEKKVEETPFPPLTDSDLLEVSLSNLRSLLSCNSDKIKSTDADDLASYQKSLEAFLEWQRYQTDLMEVQMKNSPLTPGLSPAEIDIATATALNQMLWLPYLELNCNSNSMASSMSSLFPHNYPNNITALPHISTSHFPQSSPFLTPTSPMDIDAQMKTLAMWQEAVMSQQTAHQSRKPPNTLLPSTQPEVGGLKLPNVPPAPPRKQRQSPVPSPQKMRGYSQVSPRPEIQKNHFNFDNHLQLQKLQQEVLLRQQYEIQRKQQKQRQSDLHRQLDLHKHRQDHNIVQQLQQTFESEAEKKSRGSITVKPLSNLIDKSGRHTRKQSWHQFEQDLRKSAEMTNQMALRWHQFEEEMRKNRFKSKIKAEDWHQSMLDKPTESDAPGKEKKEKEPAKLKVKNLVDPNMSPPKLLKQIAPEELPVVAEDPVPLQDESQSHLWHPLFGSNQIKAQQYSSPWRWTTVTVNGE